jgi:hypothetical protein
VADWYDRKRLGISFILGALAGVIAAVTQYTADQTVTRDHLLAFIVAGYAGADFIGGIVRK